MNDSSIELAPMPEDAGQQVRRSFRVPVDPEEPVSVVIDEISYPVSDISLDGISFSVEDNQRFESGQTLSSCRLQCKNFVLTDLEAQVVHCSFPAQGSDLWQLGIQWVHMKNSEKKELEQMLTRLKKNALAKSRTSGPDHPGEEA
ncbi:MAG TPA: PilZ domain-containing protein [Desulfotignum sp.]|nr:PilZ domain-containing protein [Desulfotignum sp.]